MEHPYLSILMYHQVGEFEKVTRLKANFCHIQRFEQQMRFLKYWNYNVISLTDAIKGLKGEIALPKHSVVITFDDGYENFYDYAYPILKELQFPSTVYAVAGLVGKSSDWLYEDDIKPAPLMTVAQMREVQQHGVDFGSHAITHPRLSKLEPEQMRKEVSESKSMLEATLDRPVEHICYPYGDHDDAVVEASREAGYLTGTTIVKGSSWAQHDPLALPRKAISFNDSLYRFWRNMHFKHGKQEANLVNKPIKQA